MSRNRIRLNICGAEFALTSDDSESYIHAIAEEVEAGITEMVEKKSAYFDHHGRDYLGAELLRRPA